MTVIETVEQFCRDNNVTTGLQTVDAQISAFIQAGAVGTRQLFGIPMMCFERK